jgi:hypothetical protein
MNPRVVQTVFDTRDVNQISEKFEIYGIWPISDWFSGTSGQDVAFKHGEIRFFHSLATLLSRREGPPDPEIC